MNMSVFVCVCVRDCKLASARTYGLNEISAPMNNRGREGIGGRQRESTEEHGIGGEKRMFWDFKLMMHIDELVRGQQCLTCAGQPPCVPLRL